MGIIIMEEEGSSCWKQRVRVVKKIGNGCQGEVFSVEDTQTQERYALKVIQIKKQLKEKEKQRIKFEVHSNLFLSNNVLTNHFPKLIHYWLEQESINILFQLCDENSESGFTKLRCYSERYNYLIVLLFDGLQALSILEKVNIIHRDIKPENILRNEDSFKLADLGLSRVYQSGSLFTNDVGNKLGRSPQFKSGSYSTKSDVWSLGIHSFYLLENTLPFDEKSMLLIRNNPNDIEKVISSSQLQINLQTPGRKTKNILSFIHLVFADMIVLNPDYRLSASQIIQSYFTEELGNRQNLIRFCLFRYLKCRESFGEAYLMILLGEVQLQRANSKIKEDGQSNKRKICIRVKETILKLLVLTKKQLLSRIYDQQIRHLFQGFAGQWINSMIRQDQGSSFEDLKTVDDALDIYKINKVREKFPLVQWIVRLYRVLDIRTSGKKCKRVLLWQIPIDLYKLI